MRREPLKQPDSQAFTYTPAVSGKLTALGYQLATRPMRPKRLGSLPIF